MQAVDLVVVHRHPGQRARAPIPAARRRSASAPATCPVIIDETADLADAADKIARSKIFDNATSCSSENAVVILDAVYEEAIAALSGAGGYLCSAGRARSGCRRRCPGRQAQPRPDRAGRRRARRRESACRRRRGARFFMVEETGVGRDHPFSGEKLSLVLAVYRAHDFDHAKARLPGDPRRTRATAIPVGIHTSDGARARARRGARRGPRAGQPGAHLRQRRRLRQRAAVHAVHGLRHLGRQQHLREPELPALHQHHPPRDHDPRGQAERGGAVRPVLASATADELRGTRGKPLLAAAGIAVPAGGWSREPRAAAARGREARALRRQGAGRRRQARQGGRHQGRRRRRPRREAAARGDPRHRRSAATRSERLLVERRSPSRASSTPRC